MGLVRAQSHRLDWIRAGVGGGVYSSLVAVIYAGATSLEHFPALFAPYPHPSGAL